MTQEQRIKKAEQLRLAAQIIETGCEWEVKCGDSPEWLGDESPFVAAYKGDAGAAVAHGYEVRVKPPAPIPIPEGWRELRDDEKTGDFIQGARYLSECDKEWDSLTSGCYAYKPQRIIVPVAKPRVPLEPCDVPPGSVIRGAGEAKEAGHKGWCLITSCSETGIRYWRHSDAPQYSAELRWSEMMESEMQIKRPFDTEWQPCSKPAP